MAQQLFAELHQLVRISDISEANTAQYRALHCSRADTDRTGYACCEHFPANWRLSGEVSLYLTKSTDSRWPECAILEFWVLGTFTGLASFHPGENE